MDDAAPSLIGCQALEQFVLLSKSARGPAVPELIKQALAAPGVYVFGELLEADSVRELAGGANANYLQLLEIFAYGTYSDYKANASSLPQLDCAQLTKLKHLTMISLAAVNHTIPYSTLLTQLDISDLRELEDLIIEAIYAGIVQAKLDQKFARLEVECFIGRDIKKDALDGMVEKLENWCSNCASVLQAVEGQMQRANDIKGERSKEREKHELEVRDLRQTMKTAAADGDVDPFNRGPTTAKKGLRGNAHMKILSMK